MRPQHKVADILEIEQLPLQNVPALKKQRNKSSPPFPQLALEPVQALFQDCESQWRDFLFVWSKNICQEW